MIPPNVLLFGRDPYLTETRSLILRRAGFAVHSSATAAEFVAAGLSTLPDVIVLCHTLSLAECALALDVADVHWPTAKRMLITSGNREPLERLRDVAMEAADGPAALVVRVSHLIASASTPPAQQH